MFLKLQQLEKNQSQQAKTGRKTITQLVGFEFYQNDGTKKD